MLLTPHLFPPGVLVKFSGVWCGQIHETCHQYHNTVDMKFCVNTEM